MRLLDTDTLTHLYAGHSSVVQHLQHVGDAVVGATIISKIEMLRGRFDFLLKASTTAEFLRAQELLLKTEEFLHRILVVPMDGTAGSHFERLSRTKGLKKIGRADLLIASSALSRRAVLVTRNLRHFQRIPGLQVTNWVD
jgi:tRNA(fMet)-specific endonuclease VapC